MTALLRNRCTATTNSISIKGDLYLKTATMTKNVATVTTEMITQFISQSQSFQSSQFFFFREMGSNYAPQLAVNSKNQAVFQPQPPKQLKLRGTQLPPAGLPNILTLEGPELTALIFLLRISYMHAMYFDHTHPPVLPPTPFRPQPSFPTLCPFLK